MGEATTLRPGRGADARIVSELALRSKGHWGYDEAFLEACRAELTFTHQDCVSGDMWIAQGDDAVLGFYLLRAHARRGDLDALFVDPRWIGEGLGRRLLEHALATARARGVAQLYVESDPGAEPFYLHHGARRIGETPSGSIPGRVLPLLVFDL